MRLIDANALMEYCSNQKTKTISNNDIARFPTAQAARPHGEWIVNTDDSCGGITLTCSECGEQFNFDDADEVLDFKEHAHFCINCGAKMGGDKECL